MLAYVTLVIVRSFAKCSLFKGGRDHLGVRGGAVGAVGAVVRRRRVNNSESTWPGSKCNARPDVPGFLLPAVALLAADRGRRHLFQDAQEAEVGHPG